jgi:hypothetical protein
MLVVLLGLLTGNAWSQTPGPIDALSRQGITLLAPVRKGKNDADEQARFLPHPGDSVEVIEWRHRMSTDDAKNQYKTRAASVELLNAQVRNHGLQQLTVRGKMKALAVSFWHALTHNFTLFSRELQSAGA